MVSSSPFLFTSSSLLLFVLVFGVVRAQLCEHARYPRTPLCLRLIVPLLFFLRLVFLFLSFSFCLAFPFVGMAVGDSPCVGVLCWHDCDG